MTGIKEIRVKIKSIRSTQKITRAMEMVATSKMKKAQQRMFSTRSYIENLKIVIRNMVSGNLEYKHEFTKERNVSFESYAYIVVSTDRGLCGGLNIGLFKSILEYENLKNNKKNDSLKFYVSAIGKKASLFFTRFSNCEIVSLKFPIDNNPIISTFFSSVRSIISLFLTNKVSKVFLVYNKFINTMLQKPTFYQVLPICLTSFESDVDLKKNWDYIYEPSSVELLDLIFIRYTESLVYQAVIENQACEHSARMVAMRNATENAGEVIKKFTLVYNKMRQASITQELSEIVAGADAV